MEGSGWLRGLSTRAESNEEAEGAEAGGAVDEAEEKVARVPRRALSGARKPLDPLNGSGSCRRHPALRCAAGAGVPARA